MDELFLELPQCPNGTFPLNNEVNNCNPEISDTCPENYFCYIRTIDDQLWTQCCSTLGEIDNNNITEGNTTLESNNDWNELCMEDSQPFIHPIESKPILCLIGNIASCPGSYVCFSRTNAQIGNCCKPNNPNYPKLFN